MRCVLIYVCDVVVWGGREGEGRKEGKALLKDLNNALERGGHVVRS